MNFVQSYGKFGLNIYSFHDELMDISKFTPEKQIDLNKLKVIAEYRDEFSEEEEVYTNDMEDTWEEVSWEESESEVDGIYVYLTEMNWDNAPGLRCLENGSSKKMKIQVEGRDFSGILLEGDEDKEVVMGYFVANTKEPLMNVLYSADGSIIPFERGGITFQPNWSSVMVEGVEYKSSSCH